MAGTAGESGPTLDEFIVRSRARIGECYAERAQWNEQASLDAIRHFANGTCDPNPLWIDPAYAAAHGGGQHRAPPAFPLSVLYPVLHGAPPWPRMANLIAELGFTWHASLAVDDRVHATARQTDVREGRRRDGRRFACILSETTYRNQRDEVVALASANLLWLEQGAQLVERQPHLYTPGEIADAMQVLRAETRRGSRAFVAAEVAVGREIPALLRPPLTIADLISWQAAAGPSQGAGFSAIRQAVDTLGTTLVHPITGWPLHPSAHHEDPQLSPLRGVSLPFDNGAMRFAWIAPLITNWMGDDGVLEGLHVQLKRPIVYGDLARYAAVIERCSPTDGGIRVELRLHGTNQLDETTTTGNAVVFLPRQCFERPVRAMASRHAGARNADRVTTGGVPGVSPRSVLELFTEQAERAPDSVAISCGGEVLSYRNLETLSNRLAHRLLAEGVRPGARVATLLQRRPLTVAAFLAIAKSGATRVSLDPEYAGDRVGTLLNAARATVLLIDEEQPTERSLPPGTRIIVLPGNGLDAEPDTSLEQRPGGADPAYILFTSGSTTSPKAVAVSHASLARAQLALAEAIDIKGEDRCLHAASFTFSAAERQLWLPLSTGAAIVLATEADRRDPLCLLTTMQAYGATVWDTVPSWMRLCMDRLEALSEQQRKALPLDPLRLVLVTGEPLSWELPFRWHRRLHQRSRIVNLYSQTETAGTICVYRVDTLPDQSRGSVPIGQPLRGVRIHLLDGALAPVAEGEVGEMCVESDRLAAGYVDHDDLNTERFVANPFAVGGPSLYRSGDLGRLGIDGNLEFVGRVDDRIELRGFRIEPVDVENALRTHPAIREAFVGADERGTRLIAYLVAAGPRPTSAELSATIRTRLPPYMVPSAYVWLGALPRTPSGKVQRLALPVPTDQRPDLPDPPSAPADTLESELAAAWARVLGLRSIGVDDDFFDLGGDSVLAVSAIVESEHRLGRPLSLDWLYDSSTVRSFATRARLPPVPRDAPSVFPLSAGRRERPLFLIAGGGGHVFSFRQLATLLEDSAACYGLQLPGLDDARRPLDHIDEIAAEFLRQMRIVQPHGPYRLLGYSFGGLVAYELARQLAVAGGAIGFLGLIDTPGPGAFRPQPPAARARIHLSRLRGLRGGERLQYVGGMLERRIRRWYRASGTAPDPVYSSGGASPTERRMRAVYDAHIVAARNYRPPPYPGCLWLFRAEAEEWMQLAVVEPTYGWGALCTGGVRVKTVTGTHGTLFVEPHVGALAHGVRAALVETGWAT
jgi:amino acid adenylation domain-containing protein